MVMRSAGQIVLLRFPQTDLAVAVGKFRPSLLLASMPSGYNDWLVCMMSSKTVQVISGIDEVISPNDADFMKSGLRTETVIRVARLAVVADSVMAGTIGAIEYDRLTRVKSNLADWLLNN